MSKAVAINISKSDTVAVLRRAINILERIPNAKIDYACISCNVEEPIPSYDYKEKMRCLNHTWNLEINLKAFADMYYEPIYYMGG